MLTHRNISLVKSAVRIVGFYLLPTSLVIAASLLIFAEFIGIIEEKFE